MPLIQVPPEVEKLRTENAKLKYRLGILQRATEKEIKEGKKRPKQAKPALDTKGKMSSILDSLEDIFRVALGKAYPDLPDAPCPVTLSSKHADYQFNGAMTIAGLLKVRRVR